MINNDGRKIGNFGNVIYDSGSDTPTGRKRIGISATEIELLDDLPPSAGNGLTSNANTAFNQTRGSGTQILSSSTPTTATTKPNSYQTLSLNREQPNGAVIYQSGDNQQLNSAVDQLLEKYAPDAIPQNMLNTTNNRRAPTQVNIVTAREQPPSSSFPANTAPTSSATHNYSTVIRPNPGQIPQAQVNNNDYSTQTATRSRPATNYDSFQHVIPPTQQQQQQWPSQPPPQQQQQQQQQQWQPPQQQSQKPVPVRTKNGHVAQVVPGKVYNLDDDPLHLLYDRQQIIPPNAQTSSFSTVFQPTNKPQTMSNPSTVMYTNTSQRYPQQPTTTTTTTTTNPNVQGVQPFDLQSLIKRVQQDYLREIQPFVSSVKFVEKDREYGQSLADVGFITPVTVRKGFSKQADDILRRSFGRKDRSQPSSFIRDDENTYSEDSDDEDDISDLHPRRSDRRLLEKNDSKQSITSVTSVSSTTSASDYDGPGKISSVPKNAVQVHNQGTSPPTPYNGTKPEGEKIARASVEIPSKPIDKSESDDEDDTTTRNTPRAGIKPARRVESGELSDTSTDATISDYGDDPAAYNEHDSPGKSQDNPSNAIRALAAHVPVSKPDDIIRERIANDNNQVQQRSEDIHPAPPTIRVLPPSNNPGQMENTASKAYGRGSGSEDVSDSEEEEESSAADNQPTQPSSTTRPTTSETTPLARDNPTPQANARFPAAPTPQNPSSMPRTNPTTNARFPGGPAANPNPTPSTTDPRSAVNSRTGPSSSAAPTTESAPSGSARFFQSDNTPKSGAKRGSKEAPASFGNKIKSFFRRKHE